MSQVNNNGTALTPTAARRFGEKLALIRRVDGLALRDVGQTAGVSAQYLNNIEKGTRLSPSSRVIARMGRAYLVPDETMADLLFEAKVMSALEQRGVKEPARTAIYEALERLLSESGTPIVTDVAEIIRRMLSR